MIFIKGTRTFNNKRRDHAGELVRLTRDSSPISVVPTKVQCNPPLFLFADKRGFCFRAYLEHIYI